MVARKILLALLIAVALLFFLSPIVFVVYLSFIPQSVIISGQILSPSFSLSNYVDLLSKPAYDFRRYLANSIFISSLSALLCVGLSIPISYSMARYGTGGGNLVSYLLSLKLLPPIVFIIPLYILFSNSGLIDTHFGLILIYVVFSLPLSILILRSFITDLPKQYEEAALVDGASNIRVLISIVMPLLWPGITAVGILAFLATWSDFLFALIFTTKQAATANVALSLFITVYTIEYGVIAAGVTIILAPALVFLFMVQKRLVRGLTLGLFRG